MNYSITDIPDSGQNPIVYMDIALNGEILGRIHIRLFREVFPAGVENFIRIANGETSRIIEKGGGRYRFNKETKRTYENCRFFHISHNNYIVSGDIYHNNGSGAGTIYNDQPVPADFGEYYYSHENKGLVSLVPFFDSKNAQPYYDSTFMITLANATSANKLKLMDKNQIVIGQICKGMEVIDTINKLIRPFAGRNYPKFVIIHSGIYRNNMMAKKRLLAPNRKKFHNPPKPSNLIDED